MSNVPVTDRKIYALQATGGAVEYLGTDQTRRELAKLAQLIDHLAPGERVTLTRIR